MKTGKLYIFITIVITWWALALVRRNRVLIFRAKTYRRKLFKKHSLTRTDFSNNARISISFAQR
jgi:hypothetical protein